MANFFNDNPDLKFHLGHPLMKKIVDLKEIGYKDKDSYDFAPIDFEDTIDSYEKILEIIGDICANTIQPNAASVDSEGSKVVNNRVEYARGTRENHEVLTKAGLIGMSLPRKYDGLNFAITPYVMAAELVSRADGGFVNIWGLQDCAETLNEFASEEIKNDFLPRFNKGATAAMTLTEPDSGSDLQTVQLKARWNDKKQVWLLNGVKRFITNGDAEISLVLARTEEGTNDGRGLSLFVYDKVDEGMKVRRVENKLGIKGSPTCELIFNDAPAKLIGSRKLGLIKYVMSLMNSARLGVGAQSIGISEAAYREAFKYANERTQFGKKIIKFPAVYELLSNMKAKLDAIRSLLYETTRFIDIYKAYGYIGEERTLTSDEKKEVKENKKLADMFTPLLKLISSEYSNQISYDSLQIHGGAGFMKDFPIERIYRDARITSIYEGTSQLQVVAAIKGVTTNIFINRIKVYEEIELKPDLLYLRRYLISMTYNYTNTVDLVTNIDDEEYVDFQARRLVEMAGSIIMGYLLLFDSMRDSKYKSSADIFIRKALAENIEKYEYIKNFDLKDLGIFKY